MIREKMHKSWGALEQARERAFPSRRWSSKRNFGKNKKVLRLMRLRLCVWFRRPADTCFTVLAVLEGRGLSTGGLHESVRIGQTGRSTSDLLFGAGKSIAASAPCLLVLGIIVPSTFASWCVRALCSRKVLSPRSKARIVHSNSARSAAGYSSQGLISAAVLLS